MLYFTWIVEPAVRCVVGQSLRAALYEEKLYGPLWPPLHSSPSGMYPLVRPPPLESRTPNQLYSGVVPVCATAAAHAGLDGVWFPLAIMSL